MDGGQPSRESLREVKREYRERRRAARRPPPRVRRGRGRRALKGAVAIAVVLAAVSAYVLWRVPPPPGADPAARRVPVLVSPTPSPTARPANDPFRGSKVSHWPSGEAGFVAPRAKAVAGYDAASVADAYRRTLRYLRAAMLDRRVLYARDLRPVAATVQPRSTKELQPAYLANVFRHDVVPAHRSIRVNGVLSARPGKYGRLHVSFRYVGVYALRPAAGGATELVVVRRVGTLGFDRAGPGAVATPFVFETTFLSGHSRCGARWPDGLRTIPVWLASASAPPATAVATPSERVNLLDPRGKDPAGCFEDTGRL